MYYSSYFFLSMIGYIGLNDLRFGKHYYFSENASSLYAIILVVFSVTFPIAITALLWRNFKPLYKPPTAPEAVTQAEVTKHLNDNQSVMVPVKSKK